MYNLYNGNKKEVFKIDKKFVRFILVILLCTTLTGVTGVQGNSNGATRIYACNKIMEFVKKYEKINIDDFTSKIVDTNEVAVIEAEKHGIIRENDFLDGFFMPEKYISKKDFVIMLKRAVDFIEPNIVYSNTKIVKYNDIQMLSDQEKFDISMFSSLGILPKTNIFQPLDNVSGKYVDYVFNHAILKMNFLPTSNGKLHIGNRLPILMYHCISTPIENDAKYLYVTEKDFEQQIKYLSQNGYTFLFADELSFARYCSKPVVVTFDDGYGDNYRAFEILRKYNAKATVYMVTKSIDVPNRLSKNQIYEMDRSGVIRFGSHTQNHINLKNISLPKVENEFRKSNSALEEITGRRVTSISYPFGGISSDVINIAKKYYKTGVAVYDGKSYDRFKLNRITIYNDMTIEKFKQVIR